MKHSIYFLLFLIAPFVSIAQEKNIIKQQATIVAKATKAQDYATVIKYTHPSLIKMVGGNDAMMKLLTTTMKTVAEQGITIDSVSLGQPGDIFKAGNELHCLLPQDVIMRFGADKKIVAKGYLIAISKDDGINWSFLNLTEELNNQTITTLLPNFNQNLKLPTDSKMEVLDN
ncbi:hypothetical protein ACFSJU_07855 [Paradesertivirga mongoliensis]|uniref:Uncharacterized protein n=1 Tax=Paradesertivirga mongoliensis TaxID=2100740 RepID=A0ABW4ZJT5_9SPHI|nr:hypothetical protein [Pedobacter mongoliensis]